jgi:hypothetical protein
MKYTIKFLIFGISVLSLASCRTSLFDPRLPLSMHEKYIEALQRIPGSEADLILYEAAIETANIYEEALLRLGYSQTAARLVAYDVAHNVPVFLGQREFQDQLEEMRLSYAVSGDIWEGGQYYYGFLFCALQPENLLNAFNFRDRAQLFAEENIFFAENNVFGAVRQDTGGSILVDEGMISEAIRSEYRERFPTRNMGIVTRLREGNSLYSEILERIGEDECISARYEDYRHLAPYFEFSDLFAQLDELSGRQGR